jgi:hypothetical protein
VILLHKIDAISRPRSRLQVFDLVANRAEHQPRFQARDMGASAETFSLLKPIWSFRNWGAGGVRRWLELIEENPLSSRCAPLAQMDRAQDS